MLEELKSLFVILALTLAVFAFARAPACAAVMTGTDFARQRNVWIVLTLVMFLAHNFWVYVAVAAVLLFISARREPNKFAMFFFLLLALPPIEGEVQGVGGIKSFFSIDYYRLLSLTVLAPAFLILRRQPGERFGRSIPDKLILIHIFLIFVLKLGAGSITDALRHGIFYAGTEVFLPYYVASRSLRTLQDYRRTIMGFMIGIMVLCVLGVFESTKGWPLYGKLGELLAVNRSQGFVVREETLRAVVTLSLPIPYGYVMAVAMGLFLYLGRFFTPTSRLLVWLALSGGLIAGVSRGPWVGAAVIVLVFLATGPSAIGALTKLAVIGVLCLPLLALPIKEHVVLDYLPFVGTIQSRNVEYRWQMIDAGTTVIMRNLWFGDAKALDTPEMLAMKQGDGIIDVVNTYLQIALERGLVSVFVFVAVFASIAVGILRGMNSLADKTDERRVLGRALVATIVGILLMIGTVSSILIIPWIYWCIAGMGAGYLRMLAVNRDEQTDISASSGKISSSADTGSFRSNPITSKIHSSAKQTRRNFWNRAIGHHTPGGHCVEPPGCSLSL